MKLYDTSIKEIMELLFQRPYKSLDIIKDELPWEDDGERAMILRADMAYELGAGQMPAQSGLAITADSAFVPADEILLYGKDLPDIKEDMPYARIAIVRVAEDALGEGNELYNSIRKIEYTRYHIHPSGFMMRISSSNQREEVRIGKDALQNGLNFSKVGSMFLKEYHKHKGIEAVKLIFITDPDFPYKALKEEIQNTEKITAAVDHIFKNVIMDCKACNLKPVCDEVEGLKELHFGNKQKGV